MNKALDWIENWYDSRSNKTQCRMFCLILIVMYIPIRIRYIKYWNEEYRSLSEAIKYTRLEFKEKLKTNSKLHKVLK